MKLFFLTSILVCLTSCVTHNAERAYSESQQLSTSEIEKIEKKAVNGDEIATIKLIRFYGSNDQDEYYFWLKLASLQGEPIAMTWLAYFYEHRIKDFDKAKEWYKKASPYFPVDANYHLADILAKEGYFVQAKEYYCKSFLSGKGDYLPVEKAIADLEMQQNNFKNALAWELINRNRLLSESRSSDDSDLRIKNLHSLLKENEIKDAITISKENKMCKHVTQIEK